MVDPHVVMGGVGVACAFLSYPLYIRSVLTGGTRPHMFSWLVWALLASIACVLQVQGGAGAAAWITGVTALFSIVIFLLSLKYGDPRRTRFDLLALSGALLAIPIWLLTGDGALAAVFVTLIDCSAFLPTIRKSWLRPYEEIPWPHALSTVKHGFALMSLSIYSVQTGLYPTGLFFMNLLLFCVIIGRRFGGRRA